MQIVTSDFIAGARQARGVAVIIDVFRAFSFAHYAFAAGAAAIYPMDDLERARQLKREQPDWLLFGERHAQPPSDFDGGNSPAHLANWNLQDRHLIHTTHAGTQGLLNAPHADVVITGALVNAAAIVRYIKQQAPQQVTLVRMGYAAQARCLEDDVCAELLAARLCDEPYDATGIVARLRGASAAVKFFDAACHHYAPEQDFALCTALDQFDFVLKLDAAAAPAQLRLIAA